MTTTAIACEQCTIVPSFTTALLADWRDVCFVHYAINPELLQPHIPFELDLFDDKAWVSLVTFTQAHLRPALGGPLTAWTMYPVAAHAFLNLRTYVNANGHAAIYFIAEWIPNRLACVVGPRLYGLPFHLGRLDYGDDHRHVSAGGDTLEMRVTPRACDRVRAARTGTLDHFLLERYAAFTCRKGRGRMFQIRHEPWPMVASDVVIGNDGLIRRAAPWFGHVRFVSAHASPGVFNVEMSAPRVVETNRPAANTCNWMNGLPLVALPAVAVGLRQHLPSWGFMWALAFAIYAGCKWATWRSAIGLARRAGWRRSLGYLLAWPGMDAKAFLGKGVARRPLGRIAAVLMRVLIGGVLLFGVARFVPAGHPLLAGWIGLVGLVLLLHFGLFDLLALSWQAAGVRAEAIMRAPLLARSLGDFWGTRWNRGFRDLVHGGIFTPLLKPLGPARATLAVFLVSGLVHDLIISLPARAGFGLPTLYFLLQGAGVLTEKSRWGRRVLRGRAGRAFAIAVAALPAPILFHPPFVTRVIVPFMRAIGCL
ncbi:MAG: rane protein [Phycisphaerales bacterium]|nr:rane protein [Phycisphaerales bacterium]